MAGEQLDLLEQIEAQKARAQSDARSGWAGAVEGLERAAAHAEREIPEWKHLARHYLQRYLSELHPDKLIAPVVRRWAEEHGLEPPPSNYAWGGVFLKAARDKLLVSDGFCSYGDTVMHTQSVRVWRPAK